MKAHACGSAQKGSGRAAGAWRTAARRCHSPRRCKGRGRRGPGRADQRVASHKSRLVGHGGRSSAQGIGDLRLLPGGSARAGQQCRQRKRAGEHTELCKKSASHGASSSDDDPDDVSTAGDSQGLWTSVVFGHSFLASCGTSLMRPPIPEGRPSPVGRFGCAGCSRSGLCVAEAEWWRWLHLPVSGEYVCLPQASLRLDRRESPGWDAGERSRHHDALPRWPRGTQLSLYLTYGPLS